MANIIIRNYAHYNKALQIQIKNKQHYKDEMKKRGFVSQEKGQQIAESARGRMQKDFALSKDAKALVESTNQIQDRHGKVELSDRAIDKMIEMGAIQKREDLPKEYKKEGGFGAI